MSGDIPTIQNLELIFQNLIKSALGFAGIVLFVLLVIGALRFVSSGGDPKAVDGAKKTISYALGGLALVLLSYLILVLITTITGVDVTQFKIAQ